MTARPGVAPGVLARPWARVLTATVVIGLPLVAAVIVLAGRSWHPVLDLAMTELRVRDVGTSHTPLIGLPGRIGEYPDQGSHPGPLSFYLLAPTYRLAGASAWGLQLATVTIHITAIAVALWIGHRRGGWVGLAGVAALLALVVRGYGQVALTQPWNPYLPLVPWIVVLLAAWGVLAGDHLLLVPLVIAGSLCAQTHVPYLALAAGLVVVALVVVGVRARRADGPTRRHDVRHLAIATAAGAVLWFPPVLDQLRHDPGNIRQLADHFGSPPEPALGLGDGVELALRHLDVWTGVVGQVSETGRFISSASPWTGLATVLVWAAAAVVAWRLGPPALRALHAVVAVALVLGTLSMARIFGRPWYYLTLWAWGVTALLLGAVVWTAVTLWERRDGRRDVGRLVAIGAGAVAVVSSVATTVPFAADAEVPEPRLSAAVGALAGPTYDAVVDGVGAAEGADGSYLVRWSDAADIGSPGFGLLDELERRGLDVAADEFFDVPVTAHRVRRRSETVAQIHLATGGYVDVWRRQPDAVEVAEYDPRTAAEVADYAVVRQRLVDRLTSEGATDLVPLVDTNLFGMSVDPRLTTADHADLTRLLDLGQPMVVFIAPPPADDDPGAL